MDPETLRRLLPLGLRRALYRFGVPKSDHLLHLEEAKGVAASLLHLPPWHVDSVGIEAGEFVARGWLLRVAADDPLELQLDRAPFMRVSLNEPRPDIRALYSHISDQSDCGFTVRTPVERVQSGDRHQITVHRHGDATAISPAHVFEFKSTGDDLPIPEPERMRRVHGDDRSEAFLSVGYDVFKKLTAAAERAEPGIWRRQQIHLLDWGCGCARIARHFASLPNVHLKGVDVDADNVGWCAAHLPFGDFDAIPLRPPTGLPADHFDIVIGVSVFSHLKEREQLEWLGELRRVIKPGGLALVSVHADAAVARERHWPLPVFLHWQRAGYVDGPSGDLGGFIAESDYYRTTYHHLDYIRRVWSHYFEILDVVPAMIGNHQDLIVLRRQS